MIAVRITMGLGNQLFQYAAALALSLEKNVPLKVDTSTYAGYPLRKYELDLYFGINTPIISDAEAAYYRYNHPVKRIWNKLFPKNKMRVLQLTYEEPFVQRSLLRIHDFFYPPHKRKTYIEPYYHFDKNFFKAHNDIFLQGFWMSWKYFQKYETVIRNIFTIRRELVQHLDIIARNMQQQNSVSFHIRRTDITDPRIVKLKGAIPVSFYRKAIDEISVQNEQIELYFFSDDIQWVKENITISDVPVHYIDKTVTSSPIEDFYLMTQCRHNVIANSTFSWWAAYLNNNPDKMVIAPRKWYADTKIFRVEDIYPPSWKVIDY